MKKLLKQHYYTIMDDKIFGMLEKKVESKVIPISASDFEEMVKEEREKLEAELKEKEGSKQLEEAKED